MSRKTQEGCSAGSPSTCSWWSIVFYTVFPFYWAIVSSLKAGSELFTVDFWPPHPAWDNYVAVFREQPFGRNILNSVFVAVSTVALSLGARRRRRLRARPHPVPRPHDAPVRGARRLDVPADRGALGHVRADPLRSASTTTCWR